MRGSRSRPRSLRARLAAAAAVLVAVLAFAPAATAGEGSRVVRLGPAPDEWFDAAGGEPNLRPGPGEVAVVVRFDDSAFAVSSLDRLAVVLPGGRPARIVVEKDTVWEDLGEIVAVRFAFVAREADIAGPEPLRIRWGDAERGSFDEVPLLRPDAAARERFRSAVWALEGAGQGGDSRIATIEVVADSHAEWDAFLYLLPMAVLIVLLAVRKARGHDPAPSAPA